VRNGDRHEEDWPEANAPGSGSGSRRSESMVLKEEEAMEANPSACFRFVKCQ
jgi:hypothetical protein